MVLAAVKIVWLQARSQSRPPRHDVLKPCFETMGMPRSLLWACRIWYRAALRRDLLQEPESVLQDFGVTRHALRAYLRRRFWQP